MAPDRTGGGAAGGRAVTRRKGVGSLGGMDQRRVGRLVTAQRRGLATGAIITCFALGTWLFLTPLGLAPSQHLPVCACADQALQVWFLSAEHYAFAHGHLALLSTRLDYPTGVNMLDNTSMPLLALLAGPLFSLVGPVGTFDFLLRAGMFASTVACFFVLRRYVRWQLAAAVGAALFGFGPYMTHQVQDHVFLVWLPLVPIFLLLVERHLFAGRRRIDLGILIGVLAVAQYFIASEMLVATALLLGITVAVLGAGELIRGRPVRDRLVAAAPTLGVAAAIAIVCLAYPAWYALRGPQHVLGPTQQAVPGLDLLGFLRPADHLLLGSRWPGWVMPSRRRSSGDMAFLGVPLVIVLIVSVAALRRVRVVRFAAVLGVVAWILALGPRLIIHGRVTRIHLPFAVIDRLPVLQDLVPSRFVLFVDLAAGIILAVAVDRLLTHAVHQLRDRRLPPGNRLPATVLTTLTVVAGLGFVLPVSGYPAADTGVARYFFDGRIDRLVPRNAVVLSYPYPVTPETGAMIWAADDHLRFSILGGYALRPYRDPEWNKLPPLLAPRPVLDELLSAWPAHLPGWRRTTPALARRDLPRFVRRWHITDILVQRAGRRPELIARLVRAVYGRPVRLPGLLVWNHLHARPPGRLRPPLPLEIETAGLAVTRCGEAAT